MSTEIELHVVPAEGVTERYAEASGDRNPIHLDEGFAQSVGLPGRILHGLWIAAQVARAAGAAAPAGAVLDADGPEARYALASLSVQFRGMGTIGPEIVISGAAAEADKHEAVGVVLNAVQGGTRLVRNGEARIRLS